MLSMANSGPNTNGSQASIELNVHGMGLTPLPPGSSSSQLLRRRTLSVRPTARYWTSLTKYCDKQDGKHVVFGKVTAGRSTVRLMETVRRSGSQKSRHGS